MQRVVLNWMMGLMLLVLGLAQAAWAYYPPYNPYYANSYPPNIAVQTRYGSVNYNESSGPRLYANRQWGNTGLYTNVQPYTGWHNTQLYNNRYMPLTLQTTGSGASSRQTCLRVTPNLFSLYGNLGACF